MNIIVNGDFSSGTTEPWKNGSGDEFVSEIKEAAGKKWAIVPATKNQILATCRQVNGNQGVPWGQHFKFTITCRAENTGLIPGVAANSGIDPVHVSKRMVFLFSAGKERFGMYADVPVKPTTYVYRFTVPSDDLSTSDLQIINWANVGGDMADVWITDVSVEREDPANIPKHGNTDTILVEVPEANEPPIKAVRIG